MLYLRLNFCTVILTFFSNFFQETVETPLQSPPTRETGEEMPSSTSSAQSATTSEEATPSNEGLHCLGLEDLARALGEAKLLKLVSTKLQKQQLEELNYTNYLWSFFFLKVSTNIFLRK